MRVTSSSASLRSRTFAETPRAPPMPFARPPPLLPPLSAIRRPRQLAAPAHARSPMAARCAAPVRWA
jgi:hypothetical protein